MNWLFRHVYLPPRGVLSWRRLGVLVAVLNTALRLAAPALVALAERAAADKEGPYRQAVAPLLEEVDAV